MALECRCDLAIREQALATGDTLPQAGVQTVSSLFQLAMDPRADTAVAQTRAIRNVAGRIMPTSAGQG